MVVIGVNSSVFQTTRPSGAAFSLSRWPHFINCHESPRLDSRVATVQAFLGNATEFYIPPSSVVNAPQRAQIVGMQTDRQCR